jgi:hypothetical protein
MTDTKPDLTPNERQVLDSLLALGAATAAKVGEHAGLAYPTTTPKLRKLETIGLAERFRNDASQTLWRAANTNAAGTDHGTGEAAQATAPPADEPGHASESGATEAQADGAAPSEPATTAPDTGETIPQTSATPAAVPAAGQPDEPTASEPEAADSEESGGDAPEGTTSTAAGPTATGGEDVSAEQEATAPVDAPAPKAKRKRPAGALEASVLAILQGDLDGQYKVNDLRKLVDKADEATGYPAASAGAIANALDKLTGKGQVVHIRAKHATFQAAPAG